MNRAKTTMAKVALVSLAIVMTACATDAGVSDTTGLDTGDTLEPGVTESTSMTDVTPDTSMTLDTDALQQDLQSFADSVANSESAADLQAAWADVQTTINGALASMDAESAQSVQEALDDFGNQVPDSDAELRAAWDQLRTEVEQTMQQFGATG